MVAELAKYDLFKHAVELQIYGLTVVPPEKMNHSPGFVDRLRNAILSVCESRHGVTIGDYRTDSLPPGAGGNNFKLMIENDVFAEAATNPVQLALVRWLCGQSVVLAGNNYIIKGPGADQHRLHSDAHGIPPGGGLIAHMCNASLPTTDYDTLEDGPTAFVPGSYVYGRATLPHESDVFNPWFKTHPVFAKAGSLILWHGGTWHGAFPRSTPGLRVTLVQSFMRRHMRPLNLWEGTIPERMLEKYPELDRVIGHSVYPFHDRPDGSLVPQFIRTGTHPSL
jgi:Phytanoyl-CoA dioxygenase (PhyH)